MLCIVYTLQCLPWMLLLLLLLLLHLHRLRWLLLRPHLLRLPRLLLSPYLRCLPRMCCCLLLVLCLLPPPLLLSLHIGYNGLERRQSNRQNRHSGDNKRNRNEKLEDSEVGVK
jgi:hypothetical protein